MREGGYEAASRFVLLERELDAVRKDITALRRDVGTIARAAGAAAPHTDADDPDLEASLARHGERLVRCKCGTRIAIYDPTTGVLRVRYKDLHLQCERGDIRLTCRRCGEWNHVRYVADPAGVAAGTVEITPG